MRSFEIRNKLHNVTPKACGEGQSTLIIASIGNSTPDDELATEVEKAKAAQKVGADVVTDHSFYGDIPNYHAALVNNNLDILVSTVGCYEFAAKNPGYNFRDTAEDEAILILEEQAKRGIDIITVHASFKNEHLFLLKQSNRLIPMTSKGGGIVSSYMRSTGRENPYYQYFDRILETFASYKVTLSLGTSFRTATVCDHWDRLLATEVDTMSELVKRATNMGVNVMVEGMGHVPIDKIPFHVRMTKAICHNVPYRVLPMATDIALGYDHISGAIAGACAVAAGADAITCMSRAEHIGLPTLDEMREAVIASRIAAHCGELVKLQNFSRDHQMSITRWEQGCKGDWTVAAYPEGAREALEAKGRLDDQLIQCGMCGAHCGIASGIASVNSQFKSVLSKTSL
jgi:phosphomethylpyrimidine synthase